MAGVTEIAAAIGNSSFIEAGSGSLAEAGAGVGTAGSEAVSDKDTACSLTLKDAVVGSEGGEDAGSDGETAVPTTCGRTVVVGDTGAFTTDVGDATGRVTVAVGEASGRTVEVGDAGDRGTEVGEA